MATTSLWAEATISGLFLLASIFLLSLKLLGISDLSLLSEAKDYLALASIGVAIVSYVLGVLGHRLIVIVLPPLARSLLRAVKLAGVFKVYEVESTPHSHMIPVWQYGSERLHRELDYQFNFLVLFTSMTINLPLFGVSLALWSADAVSVKWMAMPALTLSVVVGLAFFAAHYFQYQQYREVQKQALLEMERVSRTQNN
jgi:hypothetical protein